MAGLIGYEEAGLCARSLERGRAAHHWITAWPRNGEAPDDVFHRVSRFLKDRNAVPLVLVGVGTPAWSRAGVAAFGPDAMPSGWLACAGPESPASLQMVALTGARIEPVRLDGQLIGAVYEDADARYGVFGGLTPQDRTVDRVTQAGLVWGRIEAALAAAQFPFKTLVRTWLFPNRILEWYGEFNRVRDDMFRTHGMFDGVVPASTGIGIGNLAGAEMMVASALAFQPRTASARAFMVPSPLQCPALQYGSSFSRAVELETPSHRRLYISGTASIEPGGATAYVGDVERQLELTMDVVHGILTSRHMDWSDVVRGVAYFKDHRDLPAFARHVRARGLPSMPIALVHADVCRHDLLFEIEVDAVRPR